jgi:hypothetical protein
LAVPHGEQALSQNDSLGTPALPGFFIPAMHLRASQQFAAGVLE